MKKKPQAVYLDEKQIEVLNAIAARVGSRARAGRTVGQPSWRRLLADIADDRMLVEPREQRRKPNEIGTR